MGTHGQAPERGAETGADTDARRAVGHLLRRLTSDLQEVGRDFGHRHEMNPSDVRALVLVLDAHRRGVQIGPSALASELGMTGASVTALIDRLESVGHMSRKPDPADRRRLVLEVGAEASRLGGQYFGGLQRRIDAATQDLSADDLAVVSRYLMAAIDAVEEHIAQSDDGA